MDLIRNIASFSPQESARAVTALDDTLRSLDEVDRKTLWTRLRDGVARHERFKDAPRALKVT
jgi:hypothetical protein